MRTERFAAFLQKLMREKKKRKQINARLSGEQLAAVAQYICVLVSAGGQ
jgi:hypothetical protein